MLYDINIALVIKHFGKNSKNADFADIFFFKSYSSRYIGLFIFNKLSKTTIIFLTHKVKFNIKRSTLCKNHYNHKGLVNKIVNSSVIVEILSSFRCNCYEFDNPVRSQCFKFSLQFYNWVTLVNF